MVWTNVVPEESMVKESVMVKMTDVVNFGVYVDIILESTMTTGFEWLSSRFWKFAEKLSLIHI